MVRIHYLSGVPRSSVKEVQCKLRNLLTAPQVLQSESSTPEPSFLASSTEDLIMALSLVHGLVCTCCQGNFAHASQQNRCWQNHLMTGCFLVPTGCLRLGT